MLKYVATALLIGSTVAHAEILIGVAGPFTGQNQSFAAQTLEGATLAVDEINARGGINGETLRIVTADDQCSSVQAETAARELISQNVTVVIGHFCSTSALAAAKIYESGQVTLIAPSATMPELTDVGLSNVIRVSTRIDAQGAFAAKRIIAKRPGARVAVIDDGTVAMKAMSEQFLSAYENDPVLRKSTIVEQKNFAEIVSAMQDNDVDTAYLALNAVDAGQILAAAQAGGLDLKKYGPDTLLTEQFWEASGAAGEFTLASFPSDPVKSFANKNLLQALEAMGEKADGPTLHSFAAVQLFSAAAKVKGARAGLEIAAYLKSGETIITALGPYRFDVKGDATDLRFTWFSWNNGKYEAILDRGN